MIDMSAIATIDAVSAAVVNQIAGARWALALDTEDSGQSHIVFGLTQEQRFDDGDVEIQLSGPFGTLTVTLKAGLVDVLSDLILPGWRQEEAGRLPLRWRAVLVATHLLRLTEMEGAVSHVSANALARGYTHRPRGASLGGAAVFGQRSWPVCLNLDLQACAPNVMPSPSALHKLPRHDVELSFACPISATSRTLSGADYRGLRAGDLVLVSRCVGGEVPLFGDIDGVGRLSFLAALDGVLTVRAVNKTGCGTMGSQGTQFPLEAPPELSSEEEPVDAPEHENMPEAGDAYVPEIDRPLEDLPVTLDFRLGTRRLTLAQVRDLAPGAILELGINLADPLTILANGRVIGRGHLTQVGAYLGVQITHWPPAREDSDG